MEATHSPIVWAIDAFSSDFDTHVKTARAMFSHSPTASIHPVYVLSEELFSGRGFSSFLRPALKPRAQHNIEAFLKHEHFDCVRSMLQNPRVLIEASADASVCTKKLLRYARRIGSKLVAIGTHGRSAFSRWFAGSFAETLMLESSLPLLISGPLQLNDLGAPRALIIPTDFSAAERTAVEHLIGLARDRGLSLHFIHRSPPPIDQWLTHGLHTLGGGYIPVNSAFTREQAANANEAQAWLSLARSFNVEARLIAENFRESTGEAIIDYAKKLDGASPLIAMLAQTSSRSLLRDLVRSSPYPVYVCGHAL